MFKSIFLFQICYDAVDTILQPLIIYHGNIYEHLKTKCSVKLAFLHTADGNVNSECFDFIIDFLKWFTEEFTIQKPVVLHMTPNLSEKFTFANWFDAADAQIIPVCMPKNIHQTFKGMGLGIYRSFRKTFEAIHTQR